MNRAARALLCAAGACLVLVALAPNAQAALTLKSGSFKLTGTTDQAGAYPDLTTAFRFLVNSHHSTEGNVKDVTVDLPPGFAGDPLAASTCSALQLLQSAHENICPIGSQVGFVELSIRSEAEPVEVVDPLYNLPAAPGTVATLGFNFSGILVPEIYVRLRRDGGLSVTSPDINGAFELSRAAVTVWGVPAAHSHDEMRGARCNFGKCVGGGLVSPDVEHALPFFSNPTRCTAEPLVATFSADSWQEPQHQIEAGAPIGPMTGCEKLSFLPSLTFVPTTNSAYSPMGLDAELTIPQSWGTAVGLATSHLDRTVVTLPEGVSLNPSAGSGLGSCTAAQYESETATSSPGAGCPNDSKVGTVSVETPVLKEGATGSVYVATPYENPFHSLLALYIVAKIPDRGVVVEAAGKVEPDPLTGQLTTTFDESPQLPYSHFTLHFDQGATSPLVSPPTCGVFIGLGTLSPWSDPGLAVPEQSSFAITSGVHGGACPAGGTPPFHPLLHAGSYSNQAGAHTPFYIRLSREDGEQEITRFSIKLPPGLLAKLAGVAKCSDAQIAAAKARTGPHGGEEEEQSPSCPAASQIGRTEVEAGVGTVLASAPGKVYLAGPYHGAPISVVAITAAKVGPFDLGTVVVREALRVNPETTEVSVDPTGSDPLPHIIEGIPTHLRNIRVYMDRPEFTLNPTNCSATSTASTVLGSGTDFASESDDRPTTVSSFFQVANCAALPFKPRLRLQLKGGRTRRGGLPGLKATLTARPGDANIGRAQVTLPPSEFLEQGHLKNVCPRSVWIQGQVPGEMCPANSIYGHARATTPLLEAPLEGPVYLRTGYGTRLPEMVAALNGEEINVDVVGEIDSVHRKGSEVSLLRNTFKTVPDAPVTSFELELKGGKKGLLVNSQNICRGTHKALAAFTGQNGKLEKLHPSLVATSCKGKGRYRHGKKGSRGKKAGKGRGHAPEKGK